MGGPGLYTEYLMGDSGYVGVAHLVMVPYVGRRNAPLPPVYSAYNYLYSGHRVQVEWGIGALKKKFHILQQTFPLTLTSFAKIFLACTRLFNFLLRRRLLRDEDVYAIQYRLPDVANNEEAGWI